MNDSPRERIARQHRARAIALEGLAQRVDLSISEQDALEQAVIALNDLARRMSELTGLQALRLPQSSLIPEYEVRLHESDGE